MGQPREISAFGTNGRGNKSSKISVRLRAVNREKTMKKRVLAFALGLLLLACTLPAAAGQELDGHLYRSNLVFVTDESGSMLHTDPDNNRYEAIRLFLGEMADAGNYAGSVSFGEGILDESAIQPLNGQPDKDRLLAEISNQTYSDYTNIGLGLLRAVDLLDAGKNTSLNSAIILLTDGNTTMPDKNQLQESAEMKAEAIERARQNGYKIYTICLNVNGEADSAELRQIAAATGGEFAEIDRSESLNDIETMFNKMIFHAFEDEGFTNLEFIIGSDGTVTTDFHIPNIGVEELNVLFEGNLSDYQLTDPHGQTFRQNSGSSVTVSGNNFMLAKVPKPIGGTWQAAAYGDPNTVISLRILYNSDFYVTAELRSPEPVHAGDTVEILAHLGEAGGIITDSSRYEGVACEAHVTQGGKETAYPMNITAAGFQYQLPVDAEGTYYITVSASTAEMFAETKEVFEISVNNAAPTVLEETLSAHANIWPILGGSASAGLTGGAEDPEGQPLTYTVVSTAFNKEDYTLEGSQLTVHNFSIPKGSFEIQAADPYGAYCTFNVRFTSTNIGLIMAVLTVIGILIGLFVVILGIRAAMGEALMGSLSVAPFDSSRPGRQVPFTLDHGRGKIPLDIFGLDTSLLPPGCKFQCDGKKRQIRLISKKPLYADTIIGSSKNICISGDGLPVHISADEKLEKGISVVFKSDLPDPMGLSF